MPRLRLLLATATLVLAASGCELEICLDAADAVEQVATSEDAIVGGTVDEAHRDAVALLLTKPDGGGAICSGTIVAVRGSRGYVLTAAHCVQGTVDAVFEATDWRDCTPAGDPAGCGASYAVAGWQAHPGYDPETLENDFAIVQIDGTTSATMFTPFVEGADDLATGRVVVLSGYGRTYSGPNDPSAFQTLRHQVAVPIAVLTPSWIGFDATGGKTACFGDSGGPAYAVVDGQRRVVGVASNADKLCEQVANYGRVSDVATSFIVPAIPPACDDCGAGAGAGAGPGGTGAGGAGAGAGSGSSDPGTGGSSAGGGGVGGADPGAGGSGFGVGGGGLGGLGGGALDDPGCTPAVLRCEASGAGRGEGGAVGLAAVGLAVAWAGRRRRRR